MMSKEDLTTTVIKARTLSERPEEPETDFEIRKATNADFDYFESSTEYSRRDLQILRHADICVVVRSSNDIIHHTCVALESFQHSRGSLQITLDKKDAYIYNVWTKKSHRGQGVFQIAHFWLASQLYTLEAPNLYSEIDVLNKPSLEAFRKVGFQKVGERHTVDTGEFTVHMITGKNIYADTIRLSTQIGDIQIAKTRDDRFSRIEQELKEYTEQWAEDGNEVVLFGSGNHAQKILDRTDLGSLISYAVDEDMEKTGSNVPNSNVPVHSANKLSENHPDSVIICSEAFQNAMATRAREKSKSAEIVVLYPHVSRFDEKD